MSRPARARLRAPIASVLVEAGAVGVEDGVGVALAQDAPALVDEHVDRLAVEGDAHPRRAVLAGHGGRSGAISRALLCFRGGEAAEDAGTRSRTARVEVF